MSLCRPATSVDRDAAQRACRAALDADRGVTAQVTTSRPEDVFVIPARKEGALAVVAALSRPSPEEQWPLETCAVEFAEPLDGIVWVVSDGEVSGVSLTYAGAHCLSPDVLPVGLDGG